MAGSFGVLDEVFNPGGARAREELQRQHEAVIPTPSPGDKFLNEGRIVISLPQDSDDSDC